jgi:hypothetical protein
VKTFLCGYYDATGGRSKGAGVSPIACNVESAQGFKFRWGIPGKGKKGGFRLAALAVCSRMWVSICYAELRKNEPADEDFLKALKKAGG